MMMALPETTAGAHARTSIDAAATDREVAGITNIAETAANNNTERLAVQQRMVVESSDFDQLVKERVKGSCC